MLPNDFQLDGDHLIVNIALPENLPAGLVAVNRDPRKAEYKPDAYVGIVEHIGPDCTLVAVGDKVVFERWEYSQHDIDEERIMIRQVDVLVLKGEQPAPGIIAIQVLDTDVKTDLVVPDTIQEAPSKYWFGRVTATGSESVEVGQLVWAMKMDSYQYRLAKHTVVFRAMEDVVMMVGDIIPEEELSNVG